MLNTEKIKHYFFLVRLHKPIGILLLLWPTLWALWLVSHGVPDLRILSIFVAGVIVMRSAGCVINDIADRDVDRHVARTRERPLTAGKISLKAAIFLFIILILLALSLVLMLNRLSLYLAVIGAMLAVIYPFMKRFTHLPQAGLGMAFSWGVPMAFAAVSNTVPFAAWVLFFTAVLWPVIYDTMYAMTDREDDLKIGVKSTAILFAQNDTLVIGLLQILFLWGMCWVGFLFKLHLIFYSSLIIAGAFFIYQRTLIKNRDPQQCFRAFLNNHWVGLIIFAGIAGSYAL
jgi:4-hydroxybenzoate polyprenyltransferase